MLDVEEIRKDFPILNRRVKGRKLVYLDNAATSQKPVQVINAVKEYYEKYNANVHRGFHTLSQEASELYEKAHEVVAKFINAYSWEEVIFTSGATESLNIIAYSYGLKHLREGDEIVLTVMEHHSNMLPWRRVAEIKGARVKYVDITDDGKLRYEEFEKAITERTRVVAVTHMSNVLGTINDIRRIAKLAHSVDAVIVVDGAQSVPHIPVDVRSLDIDFLAFSGHKMLAPTGIGVLWGRRDLLEELTPLKTGGGAIKDVTLDSVVLADLPWRFEAGTPNIAGAVGLMEAVKYLTRIGMENIHRHEVELVEYTLKRMDELDRVEVYGTRDLMWRGGVIAFNIKGLNHHSVAKILDTMGIAVRSGMHCAHPLHYRLGLKGTVRASYYLYNGLDDVDSLIEGLETIIEISETLSSIGVSDVCTAG